jgi:hypothetical protein
MKKVDDSSKETGGASGSSAMPGAGASAPRAALKAAARTVGQRVTKTPPAPAVKVQSRPTACGPATSLPRFADMWRGFPQGHPSDERWEKDIIEQGITLAHKGELKYPDQCAIKLCVALHAGGVDMQAYPGAATVIGGKRTGLRAAEVAAWLNTQAFCGLPLALRVTGADWQARIAGKTGIIYFANYWRRSGESKPTGDHIDLWNQSTLSPSLESFFRFRLGIDRIPNPFELLRGQQSNWYSNLDEATEIMFWQIG